MIWPHVEKSGKLCIWPDGVSFGGSSARAVVDAAIIGACELIDQGAAGVNRDDFRDEALSYWSQAVSSGSAPFLSLITPKPSTRRIAAMRGPQGFILADDEDELRRWMRHSYGGQGERLRSYPGILAWFDKAPLPGDYPQSIGKLLEMLDRDAPTAAEAFRAALDPVPDHLPVVIGSPTKNGPCLMGVLVSRGKRSGITVTKKGTVQINGFRSAKAPHELVENRWIGHASLSRTMVERVDAAWVHGRGLDNRASLLRSKKVTLLGVGSVGSPIASDLLAAGLGNLVLVDPDQMRGANVGRHELGMDALLVRKAEALVAQLRRRFPHVVSIQALATGWREAIRRDPRMFEACDLIVAAIGSWPEQWLLNQWHLTSGRRCPIVYVWTEAHACAGHAVHVGDRGGCFACGHHPDGVPRCEGTDWTSTRRVMIEPACGNSFSPYGPIELANITTLGSELVLDVLMGTVEPGHHRVWTARRQRLDQAGGRWTDAWLRGGPGRERGGAIHEMNWPTGSCNACGSSI